MLERLIERLLRPRSAEQPQGLIAEAAAALLLEVSWADHDISAAELAVLEAALQRQFSLSPAEVTELVEQSRREHESSVGLQGYTRLINEHWDEPAKFELVVALWRLALADDALHRYEEHTIRRAAELLYLSHERFIEAKRLARAGG